MDQRIIRVLLGKTTMEAHDRGVRYLATKLRESGMEVIFINFLEPREILDAAIQEDVDVIGVSILSGAHMTVFPRILDALKAKKADDILVVGGGVIPDDECDALRKLGVKEILLQDTPPAEIVTMVKRVVAERGAR